MYFNSEIWYRMSKRKKMNFYSSLMGVKNGTATFFVRQFLPKLNILLPYNPTTTICGICPNDLKIYAHKPLFVAPLFLIAKT